MEVQHDFIVHFVNMISGKDQHILRIVALHILQILIDRIRCTGIPFAVGTLFIWRKYGNSSDITIQIPGNTDSDMGIQSEGLEIIEFWDKSPENGKI